jgi:hypothetical protein
MVPCSRHCKGRNLGFATAVPRKGQSPMEPIVYHARAAPVSARG